MEERRGTKLNQDDDELEVVPPTAERVAARAAVLAAISCRGSIEKDAKEPGAEVLRQRIVPWLEEIGTADELEPNERRLLETPLGRLEPKDGLDASWQSEGMVVLAWALRFTELPPPHVQCEPADVANSIGFLEERRSTILQIAKLRPEEEVDVWRDTYLTLHWRLRLLKSSPGTMNFVQVVKKCEWGPLRTDRLEIIENDVAIDGVRINSLEFTRYREVLSIVQERHRAFNWLLGFEQNYSQVTTDT